MALILGIDPGSLVTGYGLVRETQSSLTCIAFGVLEGSAKISLAKRLLAIGEGVAEVLKVHRPDAVALEKTFFAKNVDSVTKLSHARGVILYEIARAAVPVFEYTPTEIKASIVGNGRAGKDQVQFMVQAMLGIMPLEKFDMSDALALAIHHARISATKEKMRQMEISN